MKLGVRRSKKRFSQLTGLALLATLSACVATTDAPETTNNSVIISVLGTNDVHGALSGALGGGGLTVFSGYVAALRSARAADGGVVLLIDGGDMWQGTLESNLSEGAALVEAYNALGYTAATLGNHEFDFGPAGPMATPASTADDPHGALKKRATEADFPLLAANLIDASTGLPVSWPNVQPSVLIDAAGIKVGIIGVMTEHALTTTLAANTLGLRVAPLAEAITREALALRSRGAALVIVASHAGGRCEEFDDPLDLSSCDQSSEIMRVASQLPAGLVDHIVAGHVHKRIAHVVNGVSITSNVSNVRFFGRVDFVIDPVTSSVSAREIHPPHLVCAFVDESGDQCVSADSDRNAASAARYEGTAVIPIESVADIVERAGARVNEKRAEKIGIYLSSAITRVGRPESALGNLMTDALLQSNSADISIHNVVGGIRADLPQGELTYGSVFEMFPFDNRVVVLQLSGAELRRVMAHQVYNVGRRAGFSGMQVVVDCTDGAMNLTMRLANGEDIQDDDSIRVVVNDFLILGGDRLLTPVMPADGFEFSAELPMIREVLVNWFGNRGGQIQADQFLREDNQRWHLPEPLPQTCLFQGR